MADDGCAMLCLDFVVFFREQSPESRSQAQHLKVIAGHQASPHVVGRRMIERGLEIGFIRYRKHPGERLLARAEFFEERIEENKTLAPKLRL